MLKIKLLKALNGDSIIISYGEEKTYNILIDGGCGKLCYRQLCRYIEEVKKIPKLQRKKTNLKIN